MFREGDSLVFQRVTGGIRKPIVRLRLASGRQLELLAFHLEPAWAFGGESPRPVVEEVARRLYPHETPVVVTDVERFQGSAFLCLAYVYSDSPARRDTVANYSVLLVGGLVEGINKGIRGMLAELLARVDWEASATDDFMW
jgi:hypothetical protein